MALFGDMRYNQLQSATAADFMNGYVQTAYVKTDGPRRSEFRADKTRAPRKLPAPFEAVTKIVAFDTELWACDKFGEKVVQVSKKGAEDVQRLLRGGDFRLADWAKFIDGVSSSDGSP